jgi:hypothetical protein
VHWAVDQHGQVIDAFVSNRREIASARRFSAEAFAARRAPVEVITDRAAALANVIEELIPAAFHNTGQFENNRCETDRAGLKHVWADAWVEDRPDGKRRDPRARIHSEPTTWPLRAWSRHRPDLTVGDRIRRPPTRDLNAPAHDPARRAIA